ncbi:MAG: hypothetical protein WAU02_01445 [Candidatus Saccharimonadales bacterium]
MNNSQKIFTMIGAVAVIGVSGWVGYALFATPQSAVNSVTKSSSSSSQSASVTNSSTATSNTTNSSTANSAYKDGTFTANTSYRVPHGGQNSISATVTVSGGKIADVSVSDDYGDGESGMYVSGFESEVKSAVVGQSLGDVSVSRIGGASLTSEAFGAVLDIIKTNARG